MCPLTEEELHEVTAQVGFALWQTQVAEETVGAYLVFVHQAKLSKARSEVEAMFAKAGKNTLGRLLRAIESTGNAPQHLVDRWTHSLKNATGSFIIAGATADQPCILFLAERQLSLGLPQSLTKP
jgi:hypothetical protein